MGKVFAVVLALVACGNDAPTKMKTVDIPDTRFVMDIPDNWSLQMQGTFAKLAGGRPGLAPIIEVAPFPARPLDELADRRCKDGTEIKKQTLPSGAAASKSTSWGRSSCARRSCPAWSSGGAAT